MDGLSSELDAAAEKIGEIKNRLVENTPINRVLKKDNLIYVSKLLYWIIIYILINFPILSVQ